MYDFDEGMNKFLMTKVPINLPTIEDKIAGKTMLLVLQDHSVVWIENDFGNVSTEIFPSVVAYNNENHNFAVFEDISYKKLGKFIRQTFTDVKEVYLVEN